jgi:hypothetical protein
MRSECATYATQGLTSSLLELAVFGRRNFVRRSMDNSHVRSAAVSASVPAPLTPHNPLAFSPAIQRSSLHRLLDQSQQFSPE